MDLQALVHAASDWINQSGWGAVAGFASAIVSFVGVPFALLRAWQAKTAAEAAASAARQARDRMASFQVASRLAAVIQQIEELKTLLRQRAKELSVDRCSRVRAAIVDVRDRHTNLTDVQRGRLQNAISLLRELEHELDLALEKSEEIAGFAEANSRLSEELDEGFSHV